MSTELIEKNSDVFLSKLQNLFKEISDEGPLKKLRDMAWIRFLELGLPTKANDAYKYIKLRRLYEMSFVENETNTPQLTTTDAPKIVFVNGHYEASLSSLEGLPAKVTVTSLNEAMKTYSSFLSNRWTLSLKEEKDPFAALNGALFTSGLFIYIPPKTLFEKPLQIINILSKEGQIAMPRLHLFAGAGSQTSFHFSLQGEGRALVSYFDAHLEEGAHLTMSQDEIETNDHQWHMGISRALLKRDAYLKHVNVYTGSLTSRYDWRITLAGENAEAHLMGLAKMEGKAEGHINVLMEHRAPNCRSNQTFKNALSGQSHASFEGKILVEKEAQKTEAYQLNNNLLLSETAHAESKPNLEIFADDVKASHGATFGQINEDELFYLTARGIPAPLAKELLVFGFCQDILDNISDASIRESLRIKLKLVQP